MKYIIALAALLLAGCERGSGEYLITYEVITKQGGLIKFTTIQDLPRLSEKCLNAVKARVFDNPNLDTNHIVVLAIVKLEKEGW